MKLSLTRILTEEVERTAARQVGLAGQKRQVKPAQPSAAAQQNPFAQTINRVVSKLKLSPQESQEIFNLQNIRPGAASPGSFSIQLSLPVAQSLMTRFGDLERLAQTVENIAGTAFMKNFGKSQFDGFFVPQMGQVKQQGPMAPTPQQNQDLEDFSNQIDQNDDAAMKYDDPDDQEQLNARNINSIRRENLKIRKKA